MKYVKKENKYWENEKGELVEFGSKFMRCFDEAGKLQFGFKNNKGEYIVKFVLDRDELFESTEGVSYLRGTLDDWEDRFEDKQDA